MRPRFFYGWFLVGLLFFIYGFGLNPSYGGWGIFAKAMMDDLGLKREDIGGVFGLFTFLYSGVGLIVGWAQPRIGIRATMIIGFLMSASGFVVTSQAHSVLSLYLGFSLLGGAGVGLATIIPCQTIAQNWFVKRRALAIAIIFTSGGVVGGFFPKIDHYMIEEHGWRAGWLLIACVSAVCALLTFIFVRDTPEEMGQRPDGGSPPSPFDPEEPTVALSTPSVPLREWTSAQAIRTRHFALLVFAGCAYAVPWGVVSAHGKLHFGDVGFESTVSTDLIGMMFLMSSFGRLSGALGDWLRPEWVLAGSLLMECVGVLGIYYAPSESIAYASVTVFGIGFGAAYISVPVVFSAFFGRKAFAMTSGVRIFITGIFNALGPWLAGRAFDKLDSYFVPFMTLIALTFLGAIAAATLRHPGEAPGEAVSLR